MMDISKILDFHRMVMLAAAQQSNKDETSCGPFCPHPACWESKRRQERGVPRLKEQESKKEEQSCDLPTMSCYNMLEDYGESPKDRYPARFGGRPPHDRTSSMRNFSQPLRSASFGMTTAPFATPVSPDKASRSSLQQNMRVVEVQEVFDKSDLNSRWDETFVTKQFLVWVPNPNRASLKKPLAITEKGEEGAKEVPKMLKPKDLTEAMIPIHIQQEREDTILFDEWPVLKKRQDRSRSPIFQKGTYPKTPASGIKPDVDSEGVRELLSLPRDILVQVLDRTRDSDFVSREKIHGIIQDVLDNMRGDGRSTQTGRDLSPPRAGGLLYPTTTTNANNAAATLLLQQQKAPLHRNKLRNVRDGHTVPPQPPVFQLDEEDKSSGGGGGGGGGEEDPGAYYLLRGGGGGSSSEFAKYKKPLPAISADDTGSAQNSSRDVPAKERRKIPSISLGLPELPSGLRHTRAFVYNSKHRPDFSLVPVPTPPQSDRSSSSVASEHGTTMHVNIPSMSDRRDGDYAAPVPSAQKVLEDDRELHGISPTLSTHVPKAPAGTPATFQSPTKLFRDFTSASSALPAGEARGNPPSREITMSPGHKICVPGATFAKRGSSSPDDVGLSTIRETGREQASHSPVPQPPPSSSSQQQRASSKAQFPESSTAAAQSERGRAQVTSPEDWPQVTEPTFDTAAGIMGSRSETAFVTEHSLMAEQGSTTLLPRGRSDLSSRGGGGGGGSERNTTLARRILDEGAKVDSPAPPPPSPEPKEFGEKSGGGGSRTTKRDNKSRESNAMEPLIEQSESEESASPEKQQKQRAQGGRGEKAATQERPSTQGQCVEPVIQEEVTVPAPAAATAASLTLNHDPSDPDLDPVSKVTVSHVAPRPSAASREKLQQTFLNVDIPAEDMSSLHAEQGSTPPLDVSPSLSAASPGKNSPTKMSTPKSSAGPSSPSRKSPGGGKKEKGKGKKNNGRGRRYSGDGNSGDAKEESA